MPTSPPRPSPSTGASSRARSAGSGWRRNIRWSTPGGWRRGRRAIRTSVAEFAGQAILHALVAALVRLWRIRAPDLKLAFRLLVLAFPVVVLPAFFLVPARRQEWFREGW